MKYLIAVALLVSACGKGTPEDTALFCQDYKHVESICVEVCGKFWAKEKDGNIILFTSESNCFSNYNPIFNGEPTK